MMKLRALVAALAAVMVFSIADPASARCSGKAPFGGYKVVPPSPDVPKKMARFSGVWDGKASWGKMGECYTVAVEQISPNGEARVVYALPVWIDERGRDMVAWYTRVKGKIDISSGSGILTFTIHTPNNPKKQYHNLSYRYRPLGGGGDLIGRRSTLKKRQN